LPSGVPVACAACDGVADFTCRTGPAREAPSIQCIARPHCGGKRGEKGRTGEERWQTCGSWAGIRPAGRTLRYSRRRREPSAGPFQGRRRLSRRDRAQREGAHIIRRIAIVEDEPAIRANYAEALRRHGYEVATYAGRAEALAAFRTRLPDLALVDIGLGEDIDGGFALTRELRALSATVPIIFLSARDSDFDVVAGLRLGADDYLTKDASLPHLAARIAALFRRSELLSAPPDADDILERGPLSLDLKRLTGDWKGKRVDLTLTEFWMVHALARFPGHVKDRDALMRDANIVVDDSTITSHVKRIRRKFQAVDAAFDRIATVYGMGYRWNAE
jgi:two-component system OmpR family response regulator